MRHTESENENENENERGTFIGPEDKERLGPEICEKEIQVKKNYLDIHGKFDEFYKWQN